MAYNSSPQKRSINRGTKTIFKANPTYDDDKREELAKTGLPEPNAGLSSFPSGVDQVDLYRFRRRNREELWRPVEYMTYKETAFGIEPS